MFAGSYVRDSFGLAPHRLSKVLGINQSFRMIFYTRIVMIGSVFVVNLGEISQQWCTSFSTFQIRSIDDQHASITWYLRFTRCRKEGSRTYRRGSQTSVLWTSLWFFFALARCISRQKQTYQRCPKRGEGRDRSVSRGTWTPLQGSWTTGSCWEVTISLWMLTVGFLFFAWWISNWAIERKWPKSRTRTHKFR